MSKNSLFLLALASAGLVLVGAGCGQGEIAIPPERMNSESALSTQPSNPGNVAPPPAAQAPEQAAESPEPSAPRAQAGRPAVPASFPGVLPAAELANKQVRIVTDKGVIVFDILGQEGPRAASNFIALARSGFYDGLKFHRVVPGFVVQGGDPLSRDESQKESWGRGGPGYKFADELPTKHSYEPGIVAMANSGADTNGSQFFIVTEDAPTLPKQYSIFGRVTSGLDVARAISVGDAMRSIVVEDRTK